MFTIQCPEDIKNFNECYIWSITPKTSEYILVVEHPEDHNYYELHFVSGALLKTNDNVTPFFQPVKLELNNTNDSTKSLIIEPIISISASPVKAP